MFRNFCLGLGCLVSCMGSSAFGWELSSGGSKAEDTYWQRDSIATGRELTTTEAETRQWNRFRMGFGSQEWSISKETVTTEHYNQGQTLLERRSVDQWTPEVSVRTENLEFIAGRVIEQVAPFEGSYEPSQTAVDGYNQDYFKVKVEKNQEYLILSSEAEQDTVLSQNSELEQHYYNWKRFTAGSYNRQLQGWEMWAAQRKEASTVASTDSGEWLTGFRYQNEQPAKPNPDAYWRYLRVFLENFMLGTKKGVQLKVESAFSMIAFNAQHTLVYRFRGRNLKTTYDITDINAPYRSVTNSAEITNQFAYNGETQLFSGPLLLGWGFSHKDVPFVTDYRSDLVTLGVKVNY